MSNEQNLKKFGKDKPPLTHEQAVEFGRRGKEASDQAKREKKTFAQYFESILEEETEIMANGEKIKVKKKDLLARQLFADLVSKKVDKNYLSGLRHIQATIGEAPIQKVEQTNLNINTTPKEVDIEKIKKWREEDK